MDRLKKWTLLAVVGAMTVFVLAVFLVMLAETLGPSSTATGEITERVVEEGEQCSARRRIGCGPSYRVVGDRGDGSTWVVTGDDAHRKMRGEVDSIEVETSTITRRVVGLNGTQDSWSRTSGGYIWFSIFVVAIWMPFAVYEWRRPRGIFRREPLVTMDRFALVLGVLGGLGMTWLALYPPV